MARFPSQKGQGSAGGTGQVEKLFDTTVTVPASTITATISPAVNMVDYSEFWLIVTGAVAITTDIFVEINNFTSSSYTTIVNRLPRSGASAVFQNTQVLGWGITNELGGAGEQILLNTPFYAKLVFQGGDNIAEQKGSIFSCYEGAGGVTFQPEVLQGGIQLEGSISVLNQFRVRTQNPPSNFNVGTKVTVYGVRTA